MTCFAKLPDVLPDRERGFEVVKRLAFSGVDGFGGYGRMAVSKDGRTNLLARQ